LTLNSRKTYSRSGSIALYSFTPFKILECTKDSYRLLLVPISDFKIIKNGQEIERNQEYSIWRSKALVMSDRIPIRVGQKVIQKDIILPVECYATTLSRESGDQYIYERMGAIPPLHIEFSFKSLTQPRICRLGYVLLSSEDYCPIRRRCKKYRREEISGICRYYRKIDNTYTGLFNVFPEIKSQFSTRDENIDFVIVLPLPGSYEPLLKIGFTTKGNAYVFINAVFLMPKRRWYFYRPYFIVYPKKSLGYRIENVHALILDFEPTSLKKMIEEKMLSDENVRAWLMYKFKLLFEALNGSISEIANPRKDFGFRVFDMMQKFISGIKNKDSSLSLEVNDYGAFIQYCTYILLHTLAHALISFIASYMQCSEDIMHYFIGHPFTGFHNNYRVIIFEDASGGYGFLQELYFRLKTQISSGDEELIRRFIMSVNEAFNAGLRAKRHKQYCVADKSIITRIPQEISSYITSKFAYGLHDDDLMHDLKLIAEFLCQILNYHIDLGVYPHVLAVRNSLVQVLSSSFKSSKTRAWVDDILSCYPSCWDSCPLCVMFERGCMYHSYNQPFTLSSRLLHKFIDQLSSIYNNFNLEYAARRMGVGEIVEKLLRSVRSKIKITSPYLSSTCLQKLVIPLLEKNISVELVTLSPSSVEHLRTHQDALKLLSSLTRRYNNIEVYLVEKPLHDKFIVLDDLVLIEGSFNFTESGLYKNLESIRVKFKLRNVMKALKYFEYLKELAKSIHQLSS